MARPPVGRTLLGGRGRVEGPAGYVKKPLQPTSWSQLMANRIEADGGRRYSDLEVVDPDRLPLLVAPLAPPVGRHRQDRALAAQMGHPRLLHGILAHPLRDAGKGTLEVGGGGEVGCVHAAKKSKPSPSSSAQTPDLDMCLSKTRLRGRVVQVDHEIQFELHAANVLLGGHPEPLDLATGQPHPLPNLCIRQPLGVLEPQEVERPALHDLG
jgi:hypothetical protein